MVNETWVDIKGYEGFYKINKLGHVRSLRKHNFLMKHTINNFGYALVSLSKKGQPYKLKKVHTLLANCFIPNPENKPEVNHKNGIKRDNRLENLEWVTRRENIMHAFDNNLSSSGEQHYHSKLSASQVRQILKLKKTGIRRADLATMYCVSKHTITSIWCRNNWKRIKE